MDPGILDTILTIVTVSGVSGIGNLYHNKKIKLVENNQKLISDEIKTFRTEYNKNEQILRNIAFSNDIAKKINHLVIDTTHYLADTDDLAVATLITMNGDAAKRCIDWAVETGLENVNYCDFLNKYESLSFTLREQLEHLEPDYVMMIRKDLAFKGKKYLQRVRDIIEDKIPNSRVLRFVTATELSIQEIFREIVKSRIEFKSFKNGNI